MVPALETESAYDALFSAYGPHLGTVIGFPSTVM
jgi:hypothetical protein